MALTPRQQRFIDRFLPGVLEAISALGTGEFTGWEPELDTVGVDDVHGLAVRFRYTLGDGMSVEIRSRWRLRPGRKPYTPHQTPIVLADWERYSYGLHYGRSFVEVAFRFDLDDTNGYHVHIPPNTDGHTPAADVTPDTRDMEPLAFLRLVAKFRQDRVLPVTRKTVTRKKR